MQMFSKMKHGGILEIVLVIQIREDSILDYVKAVKSAWNLEI